MEPIFVAGRFFWTSRSISRFASASDTMITQSLFGTESGIGSLRIHGHVGHLFVAL